MKRLHYIFLCVLSASLLVVIAACGPSASQLQAPPTVTVNPSFQSQASPIPTPPTYHCGAWASNNAPGPDATITIYARLTSNLAGISGATATAVVHFQDGDQTLDQQPTSDSGGYVTFTLQLQGRQPTGVPATVDVIFTNFAGGTLHCTPAFFTPM